MIDASKQTQIWLLAQNIIWSIDDNDPIEDVKPMAKTIKELALKLEHERRKQLTR